LNIAELMAGPIDHPQSTTYRNLSVLEQAGVVHRVRGADEFARFELTEELGGHHHHLVCVNCGAVEDFTPPTRFERSIVDRSTRSLRSRASAPIPIVSTCWVPARPAASDAAEQAEVRPSAMPATAR
jgi:Ferric uptake regulator family